MRWQSTRASARLTTIPTGRSGDAAVSVVDGVRASASGKPVYWHDLTVAAYERLVEDFSSVIKVFANGAAPLA